MQGRLALQLRGRSTKTLEIFRPRIWRARRGAPPRQHAEIMATNRFDALQPRQSPGWDICSTCGAARRVLGHASSLDRAPAATACVRDWAGNSAGGEPSPSPQHDHRTSAPCKRACFAPRTSSRGKFEHANTLPAHHATFGRERILDHIDAQGRRIGHTPWASTSATVFPDACAPPSCAQPLSVTCSCTQRS